MIVATESTSENSNLLGNLKNVRVIGSLKQITINKQMDGEGMQLSKKVNRNG